MGGENRKLGFLVELAVHTRNGNEAEASTRKPSPQSSAVAAGRDGLAGAEEERQLSIERTIDRIAPGRSQLQLGDPQTGGFGTGGCRRFFRTRGRQTLKFAALQAACRRLRIDHAEKFHAFARGLKLQRDLEYHEPAETRPQ